MSYDQEHSFNNSSEIQRNPNIFDQIKRGYQSTIDYIKERSSETGIRIIGTTAGIALAAAALSGCATGEAPEKTPTQTSAPVETEEPSEPTPTPTETAPAVNEASYEFGIAKSEADRLLGIESVSYESVPIEERAQFVLYHLENSDFIANAEQYASAMNNRNGTNFDVLPAELSPTNTPQEILATVTALDRLTFSVPDAENPNNFDQDVAFRLIASEAVTGKTSPHANKLVTNLSELVAYDGGEVRENTDLIMNSLLATPEVVSATAVTTNEQGRPSIDITYKTDQGNTLTETYQWITVGDKGIWLPN